MAERLNNYLADAARRRAFREAMGAGSGGPSPQGVTQPQGGVGSQRAGNQQGGMTSGGWLPPLQSGGATVAQGPEDGKGGGVFDTLVQAAVGFATGGPGGAGAAILANVAGGGGRSSGGGSSGPTNRTNRQEYLSQQNQALQGQLPASMTQGAVSQGLGMLNAQAQRSRENLATNMASRGLSGSGIAAGGYADIEEARLGGVEALSQRLAEMAFSSQQSALGREAGMIQQNRAIEAGKPEWWETLAQAAVPVSQYLYQQSHPQPSMADVLASVFGQQGQAPAAPTRGYVRPPYGEYIAGRA